MSLGIPAFIGPMLLGGLNPLYNLAVLLPCLLGVLAFFGRDRFGSQASLPPASWLMALMLLYLAGLYFFSPVPYLNLVTWSSMTGLGLAYWAWSGLCDNWKICRGLWGCLLLALTAFCWYGVWRYLHGNVGLYHAQNDVLMYGPNPFYKGTRLLGTYFSPNQFASLIVLGICLATGLLFIKESGWRWKLVAGQYLLVAFPCVVLSGSRSGWMEIFASLIVLFGLILWKKSRVWSLILMGLFVAALAGGGYLLWKYVPFVQQRISTGSAGRLLIWPSVIEMIREQPLFGWGSGMFRFAYPAFKTLGTETQVVFHPFNEYLYMAVENGLLGLVLMVLTGAVWYVRWLVHYVRSDSWRSAVVSSVVLAVMTGALVHALTDYNLSMYANSSMLILVIGSAAGLEFCLSKNPCSNKWVRAVNGAGFAGTVVLLGFVFVLFMNQLYVSIGNRQLYLAGNAQGALASFEKAAYWYSGYFGLYHHQAVAYRTLAVRSDGVPEWRDEYRMAALESYAREYELNPHFTFGVYGLSKVFSEMGEYEMEVALLKEAISQDPQRTTYWDLYFHRLQALDRLDEIAESCRLALGAKAQRANQLRSILRKEKIVGVDITEIAKELTANPPLVPRRVFVSDADALLSLFSWDYDEEGAVRNWDHVLRKK